MISAVRRYGCEPQASQRFCALHPGSDALRFDFEWIFFFVRSIFGLYLFTVRSKNTLAIVMMEELVVVAVTVKQVCRSGSQEDLRVCPNLHISNSIIAAAGM